MFKNFAYSDTPLPKTEWIEHNDSKRTSLLYEIINNNSRYSIIIINETNENGQVYITLKKSMSAALRGELLLDFEEEIKQEIDEGLTVWCLPIGDKNSLRNLRGIEIKS